MTFEEFSSRAVRAIEKAMLQHPKHYTRMTGRHLHDVQNALKTQRLVNDLAYAEPTAEGILAEEVAEVMEAHLNGNPEAAIEECFDCIAVIYRTIELLEKGEKK